MFSAISNKIIVLTVGITMLIVMSLGTVSYLLTRKNIQEQISEKLSFEAKITKNRLESFLSTINHEVKGLSENLVMINALIDSEGRDIYIGPFMKGYKLPDNLPFSLTLCNFEGKAITASLVEMQSYTGEATLKTVIEGQQPFAEIRGVGEERSLLIFYPIIYSYTGLAEGMLVLNVPFPALLAKAQSTTAKGRDKMLFLAARGQHLWGDHLMVDDLHSTPYPLDLSAPLDQLGLTMELCESAQPLHAPLQKLTTIYVFIGITVLVSTLLISRFIAHRLTGPLEALTETANEIARTGVPAGSINIKSNDEVRKLADSFTTMLLRLRESQITLENRVEERTSELQEANEKLAHDAETREILLREVNHRVKNNLTAIISMLHQEEDRANAEGRSELGSRLQEIVGRISGLLTVHSLLSAAQWEPLALNDLSQSIITRVFKGLPADKSINFALASPDDETHIDSDQAHYLAIVLNELATNTIKYGFAGRDRATVQLSIEQHGESISLIYHDDGPGYPQTIIDGEIPQNSIGFQLITGVISKSMQGKMEVLNDKGAKTRLTFPAMATT